MDRPNIEDEVEKWMDYSDFTQRLVRRLDSLSLY